ncbi:hypothetical protein AXF42_Ash003538 [Apostasia shenzhenica]|uniref:Uncharacterized protein n=1 Tax=Apostasia shenzhenica TaxID=1088818 RepID=A0A2I0BGH6_9ASPA|nr:hypothetical protein AXF42_Ash003538 [Apostasia shenzhenica]
MGGRAPSCANLRQYARVFSERIRSSKAAKAKPFLKSLASSREKAAVGIPGDSAGSRRVMEAAESRREDRLPLSEVVADCVRRWFQDALEEAKAGDTAMQVLVGQMYQSGYGVPRNEQKAKAWLSKASRYRASAWKVSNKHPGYNASDSDSGETKS